MTDTIQRHFAARGAALDLFHCRDDEVLICGAAGTGKSRACLEKVHMMMLLNPGAKALLLRKTHVSLAATGLATFRDFVIEEALRTGIVRWYGGDGNKPPGYIYSNGSFIAVGGLDNPTKIMSSEYDIIYVQEATELTPTDWEKCTTRLRNGKISFQQLLADCNPEAPDHWLKKRCDSGKTRMLYALHTDNPVLFDNSGQPTERGAKYLDRLGNLTGVRRLRLQGGIWAAAEGVIYEDWNPAIHVLERKKLPYDWDRIWSIDFGFKNPFVWQMWAIDPDGRLYLEKEIYRTKRIVADHVQQILKIVTHNKKQILDAQGKIDSDKSTWIYPRPLKVITDHDAEDRATFEREIGIGTTPAQKTVKDGLDATMARLRPGPPVGKPRLFVCRDSLVDRDAELAEAGLPVSTMQEFGSYVYEQSADGKPNKDRPYKYNDHGMDAMRYVVMDQDSRSVPKIRFM